MGINNQVITDLPMGTRVKIVPDLAKAEAAYSPGVVDEMLKFQGQIVTISYRYFHSQGFECYHILEDEERWAWSHHFFDLSSIEEEEQPYEFW